MLQNEQFCRKHQPLKWYAVEHRKVPQQASHGPLFATQIARKTKQLTPTNTRKTLHTHAAQDSIKVCSDSHVSLYWNLGRSLAHLNATGVPKGCPRRPFYIVLGVAMEMCRLCFRVGGSRRPPEAHPEFVKNIIFSAPPQLALDCVQADTTFKTPYSRDAEGSQQICNLYRAQSLPAFHPPHHQLAPGP